MSNSTSCSAQVEESLEPFLGSLFVLCGAENGQQFPEGPLVLVFAKLRELSQDSPRLPVGAQGAGGSGGNAILRASFWPVVRLLHRGRRAMMTKVNPKTLPKKNSKPLSR